MLLTRTGTPESAHRGITAMFVDMDTPGITVRPLQTMHGVEEFSEVFFDDVVVPLDRTLGNVGQGWAVAMDLLPYERSTALWHRGAYLHRRLSQIIEQAPEGALDPAAVGDVFLQLFSFRARSLATQHRLDAGETLGPETSIDKVLLATVEQAVFDLALDALPPLFRVLDLPRRPHRQVAEVGGLAQLSICVPQEGGVPVSIHAIDEALGRPPLGNPRPTITWLVDQGLNVARVVRCVERQRRRLQQRSHQRKGRVRIRLLDFADGRLMQASRPRHGAHDEHHEQASASSGGHVPVEVGHDDPLKLTASWQEVFERSLDGRPAVQVKGFGPRGWHRDIVPQEPAGSPQVGAGPPTDRV